MADYAEPAAEASDKALPVGQNTAYAREPGPAVPPGAGPPPASNAPEAPPVSAPFSPAGGGSIVNTTDGFKGVVDQTIPQSHPEGDFPRHAVADDLFRLTADEDSEEANDPHAGPLARVHNALLGIEDTTLARKILGAFHAFVREPAAGPEEPRDEMHDSIDPHTGTLTAHAVARRAQMSAVERARAEVQAAELKAEQARTALADVEKAEAAQIERASTAGAVGQGRPALSEADIDRMLAGHPAEVDIAPRGPAESAKPNMFA